MQLNNLLLKHIQMVIQADGSLCARMTHLTECEMNGPHARFDLPEEECLLFSSTILRKYLVHDQG
jgi:hypothetical protein